MSQVDQEKLRKRQCVSKITGKSEILEIGAFLAILNLFFTFEKPYFLSSDAKMSVLYVGKNGTVKHGYNTFNKASRGSKICNIVYRSAG